MAGEVVHPAVFGFNASNRLVVPVTFGPTTASGTSTATGATSLTDSGASWVVNAYVGLTCYSNGSSAVVVSNTSTAITVASWTGGTPTAVKPYQIAAAGIYGPMGVSVPLASISSSGRVIVRAFVVAIDTALTAVSTGAFINFGVTGSTSLFIGGSNNAATYTANKIVDVNGANTGGIALNATQKDVIVAASAVGTITGENILTGALTAYIYWDPISSGATLT